MTDPASRLTGHRRVRRTYVLGGGAESTCAHPDELRAYHGTLGTSAFYQCQQCGAVLIVSFENVPSAVAMPDARRGRAD